MSLVLSAPERTGEMTPVAGRAGNVLLRRLTPNEGREGVTRSMSPASCLFENLHGVALKVRNPPLAMIVGGEADLERDPEEVVETHCIRIDLASGHPAAQAVAAGLEAVAAADQFGGGAGGECIDTQLVSNPGLERGKRASDGYTPIGQLIGAVELARTHEIDEIPRDCQWRVRKTVRS